MPLTKLASQASHNFPAGVATDINVTVQPGSSAKMAKATVEVTSHGISNKISLDFPGAPRTFLNVTTIRNGGPAPVLVTW